MKYQHAHNWIFWKVEPVMVTTNEGKNGELIGFEAKFFCEYCGETKRVEVKYKINA